MAHLRVAVFSHSRKDADRLIGQFCTTTNNEKKESSKTLGIKPNESLLSISTRWDDYRMYDSHFSQGMEKHINAFITAEGELVEDINLVWLGLGCSSSECRLLFQALFFDYKKTAQMESLRLYLADCHY